MRRPRPLPAPTATRTRLTTGTGSNHSSSSTSLRRRPHRTSSASQLQSDRRRDTCQGQNPVAPRRTPRCRCRPRRVCKGRHMPGLPRSHAKREARPRTRISLAGQHRRACNDAAQSGVLPLTGAGSCRPGPSQRACGQPSLVGGCALGAGRPAAETVEARLELEWNLWLWVRPSVHGVGRPSGNTIVGQWEGRFRLWCVSELASIVSAAAPVTCACLDAMKAVWKRRC